jgi:hypothetical protein
MKDGCILGFMPLHDMVELRQLEGHWLTFFDFPWNQPVDEIKVGVCCCGGDDGGVVVPCCAMRGVVCRGGMDKGGVDVTRVSTRLTSVSSTVSDPSIWRPQSVSLYMYLPRLETGAGGHAT